VADIQDNGKDIEKAVRGAEREIRTLDKRIADKQNALNADEDPEQARLRKRYSDLDTAHRKLLNDVPHKEELINDTTMEREQTQDRLAEIDRQLDEVNAQINSSQNTLRNLEGQSTDCLSAFGYNLKLVLEDIRRARWAHSPPIGPLGLHVRLDDMIYKDAFHSILGGLMCGFAVRDPTDKATMLKILRDCSRR